VGWNQDGIRFLQRQEWKFSGDGSETGWGQAETDIKFAGMDGDGCNIYPHAGS